MLVDQRGPFEQVRTQDLRTECPLLTGVESHPSPPPARAIQSSPRRRSRSDRARQRGLKMNALRIAILGSALIFTTTAFAGHGGGGGGGGGDGGFGGMSGFGHTAPAAPAAPAAFRPSAPAKEAPAFRPGMVKAPAFRPALPATKVAALRPGLAATKASGPRPLAQQQVRGWHGGSGWHGGLGFHGGRWGFRIGDRRHGRTFS